jgi:hypothetical protein
MTCWISSNKGTEFLVPRACQNILLASCWVRRQSYHSERSSSKQNSVGHDACPAHPRTHVQYFMICVGGVNAREKSKVLEVVDERLPFEPSSSNVIRSVCLSWLEVLALGWPIQRTS